MSATRSSAPDSGAVANRAASKGRAAKIRLFSPDRLLSLLRGMREINRSIDEERSRPSPCNLVLGHLKRRRLALKDRVERIRRNRRDAFALRP